MKNFSDLITESTVSVPQFVHPDLNEPRDKEGKFWLAIKAANETSDKASKGTYDKALKASKDLYSMLIGMDNDPDIKKAQDLVSDVSKLIDKASADTLEETSASDAKMLRNYIYIIRLIDHAMQHKQWYKQCHIDVKAGYVPWRGSGKDPKIKYRIVFNLQAGVSENIVKEINKTIPQLSPLHTDYVASIEWNKEHKAFAVMLSNSQGYKR